MLKIAVLGAGRMGQELVREILASPDLQLAGIWARNAGHLPRGLVPESAVASERLEEVLATADVAVDFSLPAATPQVLKGATKARLPLVCGVTGLGNADVEGLRRAAQNIPLLYDRNMSLGIAVLKGLVSRAAPQLGESVAAEIHETHHVHKKDAPSGTALALGEALARSLGRNFADVRRFDPEGGTKRSSRDDIIFSVTRRGEIPGEHTVLFRSDAESLELTHKVSSRRVFAHGALQAARWLEHQEAGFYCMSDVVGCSR
jgi:4-hydroxy-tetrahydrodipicolinate reductase